MAESQLQDEAHQQRKIQDRQAAPEIIYQKANDSAENEQRCSNIQGNSDIPIVIIDRIPVIFQVVLRIAEGRNLEAGKARQQVAVLKDEFAIL